MDPNFLLCTGAKSCRNNAQLVEKLERKKENTTVVSSEGLATITRRLLLLWNRNPADWHNYKAARLGNQFYLCEQFHLQRHALISFATQFRRNRLTSIFLHPP